MYAGAMSTKPTDATVRAWTCLLRAHHAALGRVEADLKAADLPPLAWYDVLLELDRTGTAGLRPFELERRLLLPQYALSRLLDRIAAAGYLERRPCAQDGRGHLLVITRSGRTLRRRMWPVYASAIERAVGTRLTDGEAAHLADLLAKLFADDEG
jgi:DNA-binding MarR family transcriptional regulator